MRSVNKDKQLIGAAGEHLVLSRLLTRGLLASLAPRGTEKADILVNPLDGGRPVLIQVKTRSGNSKSFNWTMTKKAEGISEKNVFYCFVNLEPEHPDVYVIPSKLVASIIKEHHAKWLSSPAKSGKPHKDSDVRKLEYKYKTPVKDAHEGWMDKYLEAWELLN
jgi:hypothetical protein